MGVIWRRFLALFNFKLILFIAHTENLDSDFKYYIKMRVEISTFQPCSQKFDLSTPGVKRSYLSNVPSYIDA